MGRTLEAVVRTAIVVVMLGSGCGSDDKAKNDSGDGDGDGDATGDGDGDGDADGADGSGEGCQDLCSTAGFSAGDEMDFGEVVECVCSGGSGPLTEQSCATYCEAFDVAAEFTGLSMQSVPGDKCVCDGTQKPGDGDGDDDDGEPDDGTVDDVELDGDGLPMLPADPFADGSTGLVLASVTGSSSTILADGVYLTPHDATSSGGSTITFLFGAAELETKSSLHLNINRPLEKASGSFDCAQNTDVLVRYGMPPSSANLLLSSTCSVTYTYDAENNRYTGEITASLAEAANASGTAQLKARFACVGNAQ